MDFLEHLASEPARRLIWGLVPRGIGLTFLVAYASLWRQILPLVGSRGLAPVGLQLARLSEDLPWSSRLRLNPSLLWLAHGDTALRALVAGGVLAAAGMVVGGPAAWLCALYCWAVWLSLHFPVRLVYPWDTVLLEAGFLCLFLPATTALPGLAAAELPHPLVPVVFHLLLFRVMFGFGKTKFLGIRRCDWNYTRWFLKNMPLSTPIGWRFSKLPDPVHKLTLAGMAFVELVCPFLLFVPGAARLVGGAGIAAQMVGIQLTGNFGYFNLLTVALCVSTLDVAPSLASALAEPAALLAPERLPFTLLAAFLFVATPFYLILNNWFTYGFLGWPALERLRPGPLRALFALFRFVEPLRLVNSYGVFHSRGGPPVRWVTVVEGSDDGRTWRKYRYPFTMTDESSGPRFVAPHHPRLDHQSFYDAVGVDGTGYLHPVSFTNPYLLSPSAILDRAVQRVLEPSSPVLRLFAEAPFPPDRPPRLGRAMLYRFTPTHPEVETDTGRFWDAEPMGFHVLPTGLDEEVWRRFMPPPELFHPEAPAWRRRARVCRGIGAEDLAAFWEDFLPFVREAAVAAGPADPWSWPSLEPLQRALRRRYGRAEVRRHGLTLGRLTTLLMARLDAVFSRPAARFLQDVAGFRRSARPPLDPLAAPADAGPEAVWQALAAWPHGPLRSRFHVWLLARWAILDGGEAGWARLAGPDAAVAGTGAPIRTAARLSRRGRRSMAAAATELGLDLAAVLDAARTLTIARGMFLEGVVCYDMVARLVSRLQVLYSSSGDYTPAPTGLFPGVFELTGELRDQPSVVELYGWGEEVRSAPLIDPPRMVFGEDAVWREGPERAPRRPAASGTG